MDMSKQIGTRLFSFPVNNRPSLAMTSPQSDLKQGILSPAPRVAWQWPSNIHQTKIYGKCHLPLLDHQKPPFFFLDGLFLECLATVGKKYWGWGDVVILKKRNTDAVDVIRSAKTKPNARYFDPTAFYIRFCEISRLDSLSFFLSIKYFRCWRVPIGYDNWPTFHTPLVNTIITYVIWDEKNWAQRKSWIIQRACCKFGVQLHENEISFFSM